ncbi:DNA-processing protein DprA [Desulfonatronovibrio hydrogenovorans]|uniref:DNA-processing protein DprA n=1 Tax=Desulfonatronovibrio hydrogenovorans TaxID=53245 RepID=UPI000557AEEA|nr:DNA-processing protein DprA [Desulfonatronovibrio hydrogenovorans]
MAEYSREEQLFAGLALIRSRGLGPRTWRKILSRYGSPARALDRCDQWKDEGLVRVDQLRSFKSGSWKKDVEQELEVIIRKKMRVVIWSDPEYPQALTRISDPPVMLYCRGDISLLNNPCLAVVGSRQSSAYGLEMARDICAELASCGVTIVSGFAYGIDRQAHLAAVDRTGGTIAVLGTGIDLVYPGGNKDLWIRLAEKGLILTEFSPGTRPDPGNFPYRNRIISGLSLGVLVVQSAMKSGSMITARLALDQNREVFAVPGAVTMENYGGCNHLIKEGAHLVQSAEDILQVLAPIVRISSPATPKQADQEPARSLPEDLDPGARKVVRHLQSNPGVHIDELSEKLGCSSQEISRSLVSLEIRGLVRRAPGMYYSLKDQTG